MVTAISGSEKKTPDDESTCPNSHTCGDVPKASARHDVHHTYVNEPFDLSGYECYYTNRNHRLFVVPGLYHFITEVLVRTCMTDGDTRNPHH